jgi:hypothetical protein
MALDGRVTYIRLALEAIAGEIVPDVLLVVRWGFDAGFPLGGVPES